MTTASPVPDIRSRIAEKRAAAEERYRQTVLSIAAGVEAHFDEIEDSCNGAGRTLEHLEHDIAIANTRRQAVADIGRADELAAAIVELEQEQAAANQRVREQQEINRKTLEPLQIALQDATDRLRETKREGSALRSGGLRVLGKTFSKEKRDENAELSDAACRLQNQLQADVHRKPNRVRETEAAQQDIARLEGELRRLAEGPGVRTATARKQFEGELSAARERLATLEREAQAVESLRAKAAEGREALERFQREDFLDWKNVSLE